MSHLLSSPTWVAPDRSCSTHVSKRLTMPWAASTPSRRLLVRKKISSPALMHGIAPDSAGRFPLYLPGEGRVEPSALGSACCEAITVRCSPRSSPSISQFQPAVVLEADERTGCI